MAAELKVYDMFIIQIQTVKVRKVFRYIEHTSCSEPFIVSFSLLLVSIKAAEEREKNLFISLFQKKAMKLQPPASRLFRSKLTLHVMLW